MGKKTQKETRKARKGVEPFNRAKDGLVCVRVNIPAESARILADGVGRIRHFDAASTCIMRLFAKEALVGLLSDMKQKDDTLNASIESIAKESGIIL